MLPLALPVLSFVKAHWRPFACAALLLAAFAGGRCSAPKPTVTTRTETKVEYRDRVVTVEKKAEEKQTVKTVVVWRDRVTTSPSGTKTETQEKITQSAGSDTHSSDDIQTSETHTGATTNSSAIAPSDAPRWHASFGAGLRMTDDTVLYHVAADYRLAGPLTLGGWGTFNNHWGSPAIGVSVGLAF